MTLKTRIAVSASSCVLLIAVLFASAVGDQPKKPKIDQLTRDADVVVVGKVGAMKSEWNADHSRISTRVTVEVDETLSGSVGAASIPVVIPGGEIDGVGEWYSHAVRFEQAEQVVIFAKKSAQGHYTIPAGEQGAFHVRMDKSTGAKFIPNLGTLREFSAQVKQSAKSAGQDRGK